MQQYHDLLDDTLTNGVYKGDRTGTGTYSVFGRQMRFNLREGFPLVTTKKVHLKSIIHELLWFLSGKTDTQYLKDNGVTIWDEWATKEQCAKFERAEGELGPVYGHQWRNFGATKDFDGGYNPDGIDQIVGLIEDLKKNPDSRRLIVTGWNPKEVDKVALPPCHSFFQFWTRELSHGERIDLFAKMLLRDASIKLESHIEGNTDAQAGLMDKMKVPRRALSCQLYARSQDLFLGTPFNIASYALLTNMIAQVTNMVAEEFIWTGGDCHIYSNHTDQVNEQLKRQPYPLPSLRLNPNIENLFDFKFEDISIEGYEHHLCV